MLTRPRNESDPTLHGNARWSAPQPIGADEWMLARSAPDCIVENYLFADVAVLNAPGGVGKTTLQLYEAVHVALGRPLYGLAVRKPGTVLILTAEDTRDMLVARLRAIAADLGLFEEEIERLRELVRISDVSGNGLKLTEVIADVVLPSESLDELIRGCKGLSPVLVVIDPAVSFGVGEGRVNDAEQGLIEAGRRLRNALGCCVRYIHHTGKNNAREKSVDQYAGRGGSAFADGARMVHVLQPMTADEWRTATGLALEPGETALLLARPKMSYCTPQEPLYIKRTGYTYEAFEPSDISPQAQLRQRGESLLTIIEAEIMQGHYPTQRSLEAAETGMSRAALRSTIAWLQSTGRIEEAPRPGVTRGARSYLRPTTAGAATAQRDGKHPETEDQCANQDDAFSVRRPIGKRETAHRKAPSLVSPSLGAPASDGAATAQRRSEKDEGNDGEAESWL